MNALAVLLAILQFLTGSFTDVNAKIFHTFNILDPHYSVENLAKNLNQLIGPIKNPSAEDIKISAQSAIISDYDSGKILLSKNATAKLPMASITKIMTAVVALEVYGDRLDTVVTVPAKALEGKNGSKMYLYADEKIAVLNLLKGLLIQSANDAARTFSYVTTGDPNQFVQLMNAKATALGLTDTHFANADGFDHENHYSTALDIAKLTQVAMSNPVFAEIVATPGATVWDVTGKFKHNLTTTNQLLKQYDNVVGVKTGTTEEAGESLVAAAVGSAGQKVIVVLLDSPDRFSEASKALDWALKSFTWVETL
ncbi:MAG: D-alanyl-D-alanine carboxypeptidase [Patescibacteria group bacterium]|nr:D-alanyl-D-alanine carboxypeptidase [Patescibacteria group bacterium]